MPRPRKHRHLGRAPRPAIYKPTGAQLETLDCVTLLHEELESLRLADLEGSYQEQAAQEMGISRSTFQRIVTEARRKVAQALVDGTALRIEGGTFNAPPMRWRCDDCGHRWQVEHGSGQGRPDACPACHGHAIRERTGGGRRRH